ncbi:MAG: hypothetical protein B6I36_02330 [Desulfobacteraceae bacterium 4572_35.1]|nr:MAG: hypothetical protein B6I36_02330 [Desulfobacteraceae bacterium 4572_35.1]
MELINIMGKEIVPMIYEDQPVLTLKMVDELHERPEGTARRTFNKHRERFIEGEDCVTATADVLRTQFPEAVSKHAPGDITLLTETGYLVLTKTFTDDHAWKIQRGLVRCYFAVKQGVALTLTPPVNMVELPNDSCVIKKDRLIEFQELELDVLKGKTRKRFTEEEKAFMRNARAQGATDTDIGKTLGRLSSTIVNWFKAEAEKLS